MPDGTDTGDIPGDVTWMSYAELGRLRGISAASAKRLSNRRRWAKQPGNDGTTRVAVPTVEAIARETDPGDIAGDVSRLLTEANIRADEAHRRADVAVALADRTLAQLAEANTRANEAEKALIGERHRADQAETELVAARIAQSEAEADATELRSSVTRAELAGATAAERARQVETEASELRVRLEAAEAAVASAEHDKASAALVAEELAKQAAERKARGRWTRLRAAWRGRE
jgi:hypothetical protein